MNSNNLDLSIYNDTVPIKNTRTKKTLRSINPIQTHKKDNQAHRKKSLSLGLNASWNFMGKFTYAISRGILVMLIAKFGSSIMVGQFALASAITTPAFMLADLNLRSVFATDTENEYDFNHYFSLRCVTTIITLSVVVVFIVALKYDMNTAIVIFFIAVAKCFETISDMTFGLFQKSERMDILGKSLMFKGILSVLSMGFFLWLRHSMIDGAIGLALAWLIVLIVYDFRNTHKYVHLRLAFKPHILWKLVKLSLPLGMVFLFVSLNTNIPNYFIKGFLGPNFLGHYASIIYIMAIGDTLVNALGQSASPGLARFYAGRNLKAFSKALLKLLQIVLILSILGLIISAVAGRQILVMLYTPEYAAYSNILVLVTLSSGMAYLSNLFNYAVTATRLFKIQPFLYGIVLVVSIVLNAVLIPSKGLEGAAFSVIISSFLLLLGNLLILIYSLTRMNKINSKEENEVIPNISKAGLEIEVIDDLKKLSSYIQDWREILNENNNDIVFIDPDWIIQWWNVYGEKRELLILLIRNNGRISGFCPLMLIKKGIYSEMCFVGIPQASNMDFVIRDENRERTIEMLMNFLTNLKGNIIFILSGMPEHSPNYNLLNKFLNERHISLYSSNVSVPVIKTQGYDFDTYFKKRFSSSKLRKFKKQRNRLSDLGTPDFQIMNYSDIHKIFKMHDQRWERKIDTSKFTNEKSRKFFSQLVLNNTLSFKAVIHSLYLNQRFIAFEYGFIYKGKCLFYCSAYDDLFSSYSIGIMLLIESIRKCFSNNIKTCDMGIGYEPYKYDWTDDIENLKSVIFSKSSHISKAVFQKYLLKARIRDVLKQNRRIVLFKRNSLGKLKYIFSQQNLQNIVSRMKNTLKSAGIVGLLIKGLEKSIAHIFCVNNYIFMEKEIKDDTYGLCNSKYTIKLAEIEDLNYLAHKMNCTAESIVKRLYLTHKCFIATYDGNIVYYAWVSFVNSGGVLDASTLELENNSACIFESFPDKSSENVDVAFCVLQNIYNYLRSNKYVKVYMITDKRDKIAKSAALKFGFDLQKSIQITNFLNKSVKTSITCEKPRTLMKIKIVNRIEDFENYRDNFEYILKEKENNNPFLTYEWITHWWNFFGKNHELLILVMLQEQIVTGFCPLMVTKKGVFKEINFIGYPMTCYMDFIVSHEYENDLVNLAVDYLIGLKGSFIFNLHGISENSTSMFSLKEQFHLKNIRYFIKPIESYFIKMDGTDFDSYYKSRCKHHSINNIKRSEKRLKEHGLLSLNKQNKYNIDELFDLHEKRWRKKNDGNGFGKGKQREFFKFLALNTDISSFKIHASSLMINDRIIGLNYGFECNDRFLSMRIAHDDDFSVFSPGRLVSKSIIKECFDKGLKTFDFMTGIERHKIEWTDNKSNICNTVFSSGTFISYTALALFYAKEKLRKLLKRYQFFVHFKKVTYGRIKFSISKDHFSKLKRRLINKIKNEGYVSLFEKAFSSVKKLILSCEKYLVMKREMSYETSELMDIKYTIRIAVFGDLKELSDLMNTDMGNITKRLYKGDKCFISEYNGCMLGYAWVSFSEICIKRVKLFTTLEKNSACIYELFISQKLMNTTLDSVVLQLISGYLYSKSYTNVYILINKCNNHLRMSASDLSFKLEQSIKISKLFLKKQAIVHEQYCSPRKVDKEEYISNLEAIKL